MIIKDNLEKIYGPGEYDYIKLPLHSDRQTVDKFCLENGYKPGKYYTSDKSRFSNDGGRLMVHYILISGTTWEWRDIFCFDPIVTSLTQ